MVKCQLQELHYPPHSGRPKGTSRPPEGRRAFRTSNTAESPTASPDVTLLTSGCSLNNFKYEKNRSTSSRRAFYSDSVPQNSAAFSFSNPLIGWEPLRRAAGGFWVLAPRCRTGNCNAGGGRHACKLFSLWQPYIHPKFPSSHPSVSSELALHNRLNIDHVSRERSIARASALSSLEIELSCAIRLAIIHF